MKQPKQKAVEWLKRNDLINEDNIDDCHYGDDVSSGYYMVENYVYLDDVKKAIDIALKTQKEEYEKQIQRWKDTLQMSKDMLERQHKEKTKLKKEIDELKNEVATYKRLTNQWKELYEKLKKVK